VIEFDEKIVGVWFLATIPDHQDWLAAIRELEPDAKYEMTYRFRYYTDGPDPFNDDKKNWYKGTLSGTRNYVILSFRSVAETMKSLSPAPLYEVMNNGDYEDFMRRFNQMPFVFARMMGKDKPE
jgi:hypothetical protein